MAVLSTVGHAAQPATTRVLLLGDSMVAGGFGLFLERILRADGYTVRRRARPSTGLARPDFFDWQAEAQQQVETFKPTVAVVMFGGNDVQGLYLGKKQWIRWHEAGWAEEYERRVQDLCDVLLARVERLFWVGMPVMRPEKFHLRVQRINEIYRSVMDRHAGAQFIDIWRLLASPEGEYADRILVHRPGEPEPRKVRVRAGDGIHLSPAGARLLAQHVYQVLWAALGPPPHPCRYGPG